MAGKIAQKTLKNRIKCSGIGLHSGAKVQMILSPAAPDTGVVFRRTDLPGQPLVWQVAMREIVQRLTGRSAHDELALGKD